MIVRHAKLEVTPEAEQRIAELGLEEELDRVIEYTRSVIPTLSEIRIETYVDPLEQEGLCLKLLGIKEAPYVRRDPERREWKDGVIMMISDHFRRWFSFDVWAREIL